MDVDVDVDVDMDIHMTHILSQMGYPIPARIRS